MKFGLVALGALLLVQSLVCAELQGPRVTAPADNAASKEQAEGSHESTKEGTAAVEEVEDDIRSSNQRKAAKYIDDQMETAKAAAQIAANIQATEVDGKNKLLKLAIFERLWSDELVRKKLQEEIDVIEAQRVPQEVIDPTPEQIEGIQLNFVAPSHRKQMRNQKFNFQLKVCTRRQWKCYQNQIRTNV